MQVVLGSGAKGRVLRILGVVGLIVLWAAVTHLGWVSPLKLPPPQRVVIAVLDIGQPILIHALFTLGRILIGYLLGCAIGLLVGVSMQFSPRLYLLLDGIVETWRPVPPVALVPFFLLWFGFSELGKVLLVALGTSLVIVVTVIEALERVPVGAVRWGLVLRLDRKVLFRRILIPAAVPDMRGGFRIALALATTLVIVSEFMGAQFGIGYLINVSKITLNTGTIALGVLVIGWMAWGLDRLVRMLFDRMAGWDIRTKGAVR